jgi:hypothetical protein
MILSKFKLDQQHMEVVEALFNSSDFGGKALANLRADALKSLVAPSEGLRLALESQPLANMQEPAQPFRCPFCVGTGRIFAGIALKVSFCRVLQVLQVHICQAEAFCCSIRPSLKHKFPLPHSLRVYCDARRGCLRRYLPWRRIPCDPDVLPRGRSH